MNKDLEIKNQKNDLLEMDTLKQQIRTLAQEQEQEKIDKHNEIKDQIILYETQIQKLIKDNETLLSQNKEHQTIIDKQKNQISLLNKNKFKENQMNDYLSNILHRLSEFENQINSFNKSGKSFSTYKFNNMKNSQSSKKENIDNNIIQNEFIHKEKEIIIQIDNKFNVCLNMVNNLIKEYIKSLSLLNKLEKETASTKMKLISDINKLQNKVEICKVCYMLI